MKAYKRSWAFLWAMAVGGGGCADVARNNPYDTNAPLEHQAQGAVTVRITGQGAEPNAGAQPLADANVSVAGPVTVTGVTDANGNATLHGLPPTAYTVTASAPGYYDNSAQVSFLPGQTALVAIALHATPAPGELASTGQIEGVVAKSDEFGASGANESGITISTEDTDGKTVTATSNTDGAYSLVTLPGRHTLTFSATGYANATLANIMVTAGATTAPCSGAVVLQKQNTP